MACLPCQKIRGSVSDQPPYRRLQGRRGEGGPNWLVDVECEGGGRSGGGIAGQGCRRLPSSRDEADYVERSAFQLLAFEAQDRVRTLGLKPNAIFFGLRNKATISG